MTNSLQNYASVRFWVVSAWMPEQLALRQDFGFDLSQSGTSESVFLAGAVGFLCTGVGSVCGAAQVARVLALTQASDGHPEAVFFAATAGAYSSALGLGTAHVCSEAVWTDGDLQSKSTYLPSAHQGIVRSQAALSTSGEQGVVCVSTPGITTDESLAQSLAHWGELENLELYGVAEAARMAGVAWGAVLGVSNRVGPNSHSEWKEHHLEASLAAQKKLRELYLRECIKS
ncbi:MAG: hypothetical protein RJB13_357 [Pseudomonadota bacterium]